MNQHLNTYWKKRFGGRIEFLHVIEEYNGHLYGVSFTLPLDVYKKLQAGESIPNGYPVFATLSSVAYVSAWMLGKKGHHTPITKELFQEYLKTVQQTIENISAGVPPAYDTLP